MSSSKVKPLNIETVKGDQSKLKKVKKPESSRSREIEKKKEKPTLSIFEGVDSLSPITNSSFRRLC